jgi:hypothetical protein
MKYTLREIDLLKDVKADHLSLPQIKFKIEIETDSEFEKLVDKGKESILLQKMHDVAQERTNEVAKQIGKEIEKIDIKMVPTVGRLSPDQMKQMVQQLNATLAQIGEAQKGAIQAAVKKVWQDFVGREKTLAHCKFETRIEVVKGVVAIAAATAAFASAAVTAGASIFLVVGILKSAGEIGIRLHEKFKKIDEVAKELQGKRERLRKILKEKMSSRTREALSASSPFAFAMDTIRNCEESHKQLVAKIAEGEKDANDLVGKLNQALDKIRAIKNPSPDQKKYVEKLAKANELFLDKIIKSTVLLKKYIKECEEAHAEIKGWQKDQLANTEAAIKCAELAGIGLEIVGVAHDIAVICGAPIP